MDPKKFLWVLCILSVIAPAIALGATTIRPDSKGYYANWSAQGCTVANGWQCVDEATVNISDRVYKNTNSVKETFGFQNTSLTTETINSVKLYYYAYRYGSSKYRMQPLIRSGATDYSGNVFNLTASYAYYSQAYATNPATGSAWTVSEVNALEAGMSTYSSNGGAYVAQVYAVVDYNPLPDLVISNLSFSKSSAYEGETVTVYVTTKNNGPGNAGASTTRVDYSNLSQEFGVSALNNGSAQQDYFNYTCEASNMTFTATADYYGNVTEADESNNQKSNTLVCIPKPDLVIDSISFYEYVQTINYTNRTFVNVTTMVKNNGLGSAGNSTTRTVGLATYYRATNPLAPGATQSFNEDYECTSAHNYTATADYYGVVAESDESNNQMVTFIDCVV